MRLCKEGKIDTRNTRESADSMNVLSLGEGRRGRERNSFTITYAEGHFICRVAIDDGISLQSLSLFAII